MKRYSFKSFAIATINWGLDLAIVVDKAISMADMANELDVA
jgi:hypothetical protein